MVVVEVVYVTGVAIVVVYVTSFVLVYGTQEVTVPTHEESLVYTEVLVSTLSLQEVVGFGVGGLSIDTERLTVMTVGTPSPPPLLGKADVRVLEATRAMSAVVKSIVACKDLLLEANVQATNRIGCKERLWSVAAELLSHGEG